MRCYGQKNPTTRALAGTISFADGSNFFRGLNPFGYYGNCELTELDDRYTNLYSGYVGTITPYIIGTGPGDIQPRAGNNVASGSFSTVGGGQFNEAFGHNNFIAGGSSSIATKFTRSRRRPRKRRDLPLSA